MMNIYIALAEYGNRCLFCQDVCLRYSISFCDFEHRFPVEIVNPELCKQCLYRNHSVQSTEDASRSIEARSDTVAARQVDEIDG